MAGKWTGVVAVPVLILTFVTGCNITPGLRKATSHPGSNGTTNTTGHASNPSVNKAPDAKSLSAIDMEKISLKLIGRYIQSFNDKTLVQYKADADRIFYPGLAKFAVSSARAGVEYNNPVKSHSITIRSVAAPDMKTFVAEAILELHFQDGKFESHHYQFSFARNPLGNWTIQSMRGA